ncbi:Arc family DNA-binding protein [Mesorhizobium sp. M0136]|uniref:Arc family DNA-binding protein n=1 Tax=Mesorhizobium sp. M0136 TaxID=2956890 RepID=UPI00333C276C
MGKRGPAPGSGKTPIFTMRLPTDLREKLTEKAEAAGLSLSRQIELRLSKSFDEEDAIENRFGSKENYRIMQVLGMAIDAAKEKYDAKSWLHDPEVFDLVVETFNRTIAPLRPTDDRQMFERASPTQRYSDAINIARQSWAAVAEAKSPRTKYIKADLADVADRPTIHRGEFELRSKERLAQFLFEGGMPASSPDDLEDRMKWLRQRGELLQRAENEIAAEMISEGKDPRLSDEDTF